VTVNPSGWRPSAPANEQGEASHAKYKDRQKKAVIRRLQLGMREMKTAVLCRCGHSSDKPFCDGSHVKTGFADAARFAAGPGATAGVGRVTITPIADGPNRCEGPLTIRDADGRTFESDSSLLCRCGGSHHKPFCDGTHEEIGFRG